jgi:hydroxymethylbilane synthase
VRIGTRGSALALTQSGWVADRLRERLTDTAVELVTIRTKGDILQDVSLAKIGGKGLFIKEIEEALLEGEIDLAVHSMKDLPAALPEGLTIAATPPREDPRDVLISRDNLPLEALAAGARIGTGSLRRSAQLRHRFPHLEIVSLRGNLDTRIRKIDTGGLDGVILAAAGIRRMGWEAKISQWLPVSVMLPAVGQGILAIETRRSDAALVRAVGLLNDPVAACEAEAERAFLARLGGGCQLPIAGHAVKSGETLRIEGLVASVDGAVMIRDAVEGPAAEAGTLGSGLADHLLAAGGRALLAEACSPQP